MNKMVERLQNILIIRGNWITLLNCTTSQCCLHFSRATEQLADNYESNKNELDSVNINNDIRSIIESIKKNHKTMNVKDVIKTMNKLHTSLNNDKQLGVKNLKEIEGFEYMCHKILKNARTLSTYNTIRILHVLLSFNVLPDSILIQTLLQLLSACVNKLSVGQIMMLHAMLHNVQDIPMVRALLKASSNVFNKQAENELDLENTNLIKVLRFCSVIKDVQTKRYIIKLLANNDTYIDLNYIIDFFYAIYTLPALCTSSKKLLIKLCNIIEKNAHFLKFNEIETLLHYISSKFVNSEMDFFNQTTVNALCTVVLNNKSTFTEIIVITKHLNKMRYSNIDLLNYLLKRCLVDENVFIKYKTIQIDHLVTALVIANYKLHNWAIVEKMLLNYVINVEFSLYNRVSMAFRLLSLDCYHPELLNEVFTSYNACHYVENKQNTLIALKLHWCVKHLYPQYRGAMVDESKLKQTVVEYNSNNMPHLRESLEEAVGGSKYIKSNLITKVGELIDHAIVMRPDGSFMNIENCNIKFAEELVSFSESTKILLFGYPKEAYCTNTRNLLSTVKMLLKVIETSTGSYSFVINPFLWENYSSTKRIEYLQEGIKLKHTDNSDN